MSSVGGLHVCAEKFYTTLHRGQIYIVTTVCTYSQKIYTYFFIFLQDRCGCKLNFSFTKFIMRNFVGEIWFSETKGRQRFALQYSCTNYRKPGFVFIFFIVSWTNLKWKHFFTGLLYEFFFIKFSQHFVKNKWNMQCTYGKVSVQLKEEG